MKTPQPDAVARAWAGYREQVVPAGAGAVQVQESQRAFYAGAWALFNLILEQPDTAEGSAQVAAFGHELSDFAGMQLDAEGQRKGEA
jgi:hypothetical protein